MAPFCVLLRKTPQYGPLMRLVVYGRRLSSAGRLCRMSETVLSLLIAILSPASYVPLPDKAILGPSCRVLQEVA